MSTVVFDPAAWAAQYPVFASVPATEATGYFNQATLYLANSDCSPVADLGQRGTLLGLLTAHIAELNGCGRSGLVGRINSATQGSVSVASELTGLPGSAAWYAQTQYGLMYWAATAQYRTFRYRPGPQPSFGRWPVGYRSGW